MDLAVQYPRLYSFLVGAKVNTTSDVQNTNLWHFTFYNFLNIMERLYRLSTINTGGLFLQYRNLCEGKIQNYTIQKSF